VSRLLDGLAEPVTVVFARVVGDAAVDGASPHPTVDDAVEALAATLAALDMPLETYQRAFDAASDHDRASHEPARARLLEAANHASAAHAEFTAHVVQKRDLVRERIADLGRSAQGVQAYVTAHASAVNSAYGLHAVRSSPR
jgi:hypothetical protein